MFIMKKKQNTLLSDMRIMQKLSVLIGAELLVFLFLLISMILSIRYVQEELSDTHEKTAIHSAEALMEMTIENGVSIARSIYTNEDIYLFLNQKYAAASDYFDAYYQFQQNHLLTVAEGNLISKYTIYTANETVISGGGIKKIQESVKSEEWYITFSKLNKALILWCNPETGSLSLIRRLDYHSMSAGSAILKLDLNLSLFQNYCENLDFDGRLYIISGKTILYAGEHTGISSEDLDITQDFSSFTQNYYTADIDYYTQADAMPIYACLSGNIPLWIMSLLAFLLMNLMMIIFFHHSGKRITDAAACYQKEGSFFSLREKETGTDELGLLFSACILLSEKIMNKNLQSHHLKQELAHQTAAYQVLYGKALLLDSAYPEQKHLSGKNSCSLDEELSRIAVLAKNYPDVKLQFADNLPSDLQIPVNAFMHIAGYYFPYGGRFTAEYQDSAVLLTWQSSVIPDKAEILKIRAVFEEPEVSSVYPFQEHSRYNPYLYLVHFFGRQITLHLTETPDFMLQFILKTE